MIYVSIKTPTFIVVRIYYTQANVHASVSFTILLLISQYFSVYLKCICFACKYPNRRRLFQKRCQNAITIQHKNRATSTIAPSYARALLYYKCFVTSITTTTSTIYIRSKRDCKINLQLRNTCKRITAYRTLRVHYNSKLYHFAHKED